ncbi:hypothetical protein D3C75_1373330 [compost metagenome]
MGITRFLMHGSSDSMAEQVTYHGKSVLLGMGLNRVHHITDAVSGNGLFDT